MNLARAFARAILCLHGTNILKTKICIVGICFVSLAFAGCASSSSEMSQKDVDALKHPSRSIPKEAAEGMAHMGESMAAQRKLNAEKGVDDHGIPIAKSTSNEKAPDVSGVKKDTAPN